MKIIRSKTMKILILKPIFMTILACSLGFWGGSASAENLKVALAAEPTSMDLSLIHI